MSRPPRKSAAAERLIIGATAPAQAGKVGVGTRQGRVVLTFPEAITWIGFGKREALQIAMALIEHAAKLPERE